MFGPPTLFCFFLSETNAFPVYAMCYHETVHDKSVLQTENGLERGFVKQWLNSV